MLIKSLSLSDWRQFGAVDISFHPQLTILTGSNGAGKSTLLKIISQAFGQYEVLIATPFLSRDRSLKYNSGVLNPKLSLSKDYMRNMFNKIGSIKLGNDQNYLLQVPKDTGASYNVTIFKDQVYHLEQLTAISDLKGIFIRSHRPITSYQQVGNIPTNIITAQNAFAAYQETMSNFLNNNYTQYSSTYRIKEAIISMATFGPGNQNVQGNEIINDIYINFKAILHKILPPEIGFKDISVRMPDVVLVTDSGDFILDSSSGGLMSLIDLAWQIFLFSIDNPSFTVLLDEPENHLHPSMQRTVMVSLLNAFPNVQFIVATHSPFVVTSVKDSYVYVLRHEKSKELNIPKRIFSEALNTANKSATASETLRDVLGVPVTMPMWAEDEINKIAQKLSAEPFSEKTLDKLRGELSKTGLDEHFPSALNRLLENKND